MEWREKIVCNAINSYYCLVYVLRNNVFGLPVFVKIYCFVYCKQYMANILWWAMVCDALHCFVFVCDMRLCCEFCLYEYHISDYDASVSDQKQQIMFNIFIFLSEMQVIVPIVPNRSQLLCIALDATGIFAAMGLFSSW